MVVETVRLDQIDDVEFIALTLFGVCESKVKPLGQLHSAAMVELQLQIVFKFTDLGCLVQISAFEARFEYQRCVLCASKLVKIW